MAITNSTLQSRALRLLGVEQGEGRALALSTGLYFLFAAAFVFVQTTAYGLFIQEFGARNLPLAYLSIAVFASLLAYVYLKISEQVPFKVLAFIDVGFLAAVCLVFWIGLQTRLSHWFIFLLPFWFQTIINLANLVVWPLAGRVFDVRQAKRLFGLIGGGNWLANIFFGGLVVAPLVALVGTANLYLFAALAVVGAGIVLWAIFAGHMVPAATVQPAAEPQHAGSAKKSASSPFQKPYNRLIFAYVLLWWVSFYFIDNIFYDRAGAMYPDGAQLAAFIGRQLSVIGVIALITAILLTGRIVRRFGVRTALLTMPMTVVVGMLVLVVAGILQAPAVVLFWIAAVAKTLNVGLGFSLSLAVGTLLYQPILGMERNRTQTIAEGIVQPLAIGLAGLLLLIFNTALHFNAIELGCVFLVIGGIWLWVILRLSRHYPQVLSEALVKRSLGETTTLPLDPSGVAQLQASLKSPHPGAVLYALNQLEELDPLAWNTNLGPALPGLLSHPSPEVRSYVVQRLVALGLAEPLALVRGRLAQESDRRVCAWMVQYLAALDDASAEQVSNALASPEAVIRRGAITGLLASGRTDKVDSARASLHQLASSADADERLMAAKILSDAVCPGSGQDVRTLLADEALAVRQAAVRAAAMQQDADLVEDVVAACHVPGTERVAEQALISKGVAALPAIFQEWNKDDTSPVSQGTYCVARVLGRIGGDQAVRALQSRIDCPDAEFRLQVLRSLSGAGFRFHSMRQLFDHLKPELAQAAWITAAIDTVQQAQGPRDLAILSDALSSAFMDARRRTLLLLSFGLDAQAVLRAAHALDEAGGSPSAFALEAVDALLPSTWKLMVLPLMENIPIAERLNRWRAAGIDVPALSIDALVNSLVAPESRARFSRWATLCALHLAGVMQLRACEPAVRALSMSPDSVLSSLACWSLAEMGFDVAIQGEAIMLSLVEKVLALKSASLFRETPDSVLADVAERVQEVVFDKGQIIFHKGDPGDSLYIIVSGTVQVRDGSRLLNELTDGGIFGELALLDPEPRSATVTAVEPAHLLQLDAAHFRLVLAERPEVSTAIIHVLTSYIRRLLKDGDGGSAAQQLEIFEP